MYTHLKSSGCSTSDDKKNKEDNEKEEKGDLNEERYNATSKDVLVSIVIIEKQT